MTNTSRPLLYTEVDSAAPVIGGDLITLAMRRRRIAIFALTYGQIRDHTMIHLEHLREVCDAIIVTADYVPSADQILKIRNLADYCHFAPHNGGQWRSYAKGFAIAEKYNLVAKSRELIFCGDTLLGPFARYASFLSDIGEDQGFWTLTNSWEKDGHLDLSFLALTQDPVIRRILQRHFRAVSHVSSDDKAQQRAADALLAELIAAGIKGHGIARIPEIHFQDKKFDFSKHPAQLLQAGCPFISVRSMEKSSEYNEDGLIHTLAEIQKRSPEIHNLIQHELMEKYGDSPSPWFSIIMPAWNRAHTIEQAIDSALGQTWDKFELLIIDDGSTDGTCDVLHEKYAPQLASGKIRLFALAENMGVSRARNVGLENAAHPWIAYLDSDNIIDARFLETYAGEIMANPQYMAFYSKILHRNSGKVIGAPFDYQYMATRENRIDMGSFVHNVELFHELGGFDESMRRFVDYELILRYTAQYSPFFIDTVLTLYNDGDLPRITNSAHQRYHHQLVRHKYAGDIKISVLILASGKASRRTLAGAIMQAGDFAHDLAFLTEPVYAEELTQWRRRLPQANPAAQAPVLTWTSLGEYVAASTSEYFVFLHDHIVWLSPKRLSTLLMLHRMRPEFAPIACRPPDTEVDARYASALIPSPFLAACLERYSSLGEMLAALDERMQSAATSFISPDMVCASELKTWESDS